MALPFSALRRATVLISRVRLLRFDKDYTTPTPHRLCAHSRTDHGVTISVCVHSRALSREIHVVKSDGVEVISPPLRAVGPTIWFAYSGVHCDACLPLLQAVPSKPLLLRSLTMHKQATLDFISAVAMSLALLNYTLVSGLADCVGRQETRHTSLSTSTLSARLSSVCYTLLFGKCMPHRPKQSSLSRGQNYVERQARWSCPCSS